MNIAIFGLACVACTVCSRRIGSATTAQTETSRLLPGLPMPSSGRAAGPASAAFGGRSRPAGGGVPPETAFLPGGASRRLLALPSLALGALAGAARPRRGGGAGQQRRGKRRLLAAAPAAQQAVAPGAQKVLKVAVAGGGVGGLTTALSLLRAGIDVTFYEKTSQYQRFGGPIQLASNALSTLKAIDEGLFGRVMDKFSFTASRRCGLKDGMRSDNFKMTPITDPRYLFDKSVPADWYLDFPLQACADAFQLPYTGVINRPDLQDILLDECRKLKPDFIVNGAGVTGYTNTPEGVNVKLSDGSTADAHVLVGSDGIWSAVRAQMYEEGEVKAKSDNGWKQQECPYSGYTVFAGEFTPESTADFPDYFDCGYKVYIGPKKYFVTSDVGEGRVQWYAFIAQPPGTKRAGDSWDGGASTAEQGTSVISYLKLLFAGWTHELHYVLDNTPASAVEQRDLYDRWPEFFRSWADGSTVLLGDAVHPMMPNLGQGGGMAIEDSYELAEALKDAVAEAASGVPEPAALQRALQGFYEKRVGRVAGVSLLSRLASDLIINLFDTPWSPHDSKGQSVLSFLLFFWKPLLQYVVFPLQFLFLYSYHPTGGMGDLPRQLEEAWRKRHRIQAEEAFARAKAEGQHVGGPSFFAKVEAE